MRPIPTATLALLVLALLPHLTHCEDWPRWRGPRGDGTWQAPPIPDEGPDDFEQRWRVKIGGGYAGIIVVGDRLWTMDRQGAPDPAKAAATEDAAPAAAAPEEVERVLCFATDDGRLLWEHRDRVTYGSLDYGNGPRAAPTFHDGRIYTLGAVGHLNCLDARDGRVIWAKDLVADHGAVIPEWGLAASPVIWNDLVIVHPGLKAGGCIVACDRRDGREVWRAGDDPAGYATPIVIRSGDTEQLVAWTPKHVLGIDPRDGRIAWSVPYEVTYGVSIATPIFAEGTVFVAGYWEGSKAIRLSDDLQTATLLWDENRHLRGLMSQPLYRDGHVYLLDKQHGLTCFKLATGEVLWNDGNRLTPRGRNPQAALVWLGESGDGMIALNAEGELVLARLTPQGYEESMRARIVEPTWAHPAFAGDSVYARGDTELVAIRLPRGD